MKFKFDGVVSVSHRSHVHAEFGLDGEMPQAVSDMGHILAQLSRPCTVSIEHGM
jgi:hypothetical protein